MRFLTSSFLYLIRMLKLLVVIAIITSSTTNNVVVTSQAIDSNKKYAYVSILSSSTGPSGNGYVAGLIALSTSLRSVGSSYPLICLISEPPPPPVDDNDDATKTTLHTHDAIKQAGWDVIYVDDITNPYHDSDERFRSVFGKIHLWNLTSYDKILYLDADVLAIQNLDHLFRRPIQKGTIAAAPDMLFPDRFSSGVMLLLPSRDTFAAMTSAMHRLDSYDGADQGFFNSFFPEWYGAWPAANRLPFGCNVDQDQVSLYGRAWRYMVKRREVAVFHFTTEGGKPWNARRGSDKSISFDKALLLHLWELCVAVSASDDHERRVHKDYFYYVIDIVDKNRIEMLFTVPPLTSYDEWLELERRRNNERIKKSSTAKDESKKRYLPELSLNNVDLDDVDALKTLLLIPKQQQNHDQNNHECKNEPDQNDTPTNDDEFHTARGHATPGLHLHPPSTKTPTIIPLQQTTQFPLSCLPPTLLSRRTTDGVDVKIAPDELLRPFLKSRFSDVVVRRFDALPWPHKGDLWRYAWLYVVGGIYLDIKTVATAPLRETFESLWNDYYDAAADDDDGREEETTTAKVWYAVYSTGGTTGDDDPRELWNHVHNGILASPPENPFMLRLLALTIATDAERVRRDGDVFIKQFYHQVVAVYGRPLGGGMMDDNDRHQDRGNDKTTDHGLVYNNWKLVLLDERCSDSPEKPECQKFDGRTDRYGLCCNIYDARNSLRFRTRDPDYPWVKQCPLMSSITSSSSHSSSVNDDDDNNDKNDESTYDKPTTITQDIGDDDDNKQQIATLFQKALRYHQNGDWGRAESIYRDIIDINPNIMSDVFNNLALLLANTGREEEARDVWEWGWLLFPGNALLSRNKPVVYRSAKQHL